MIFNTWEIFGKTILEMTSFAIFTVKHSFEISILDRQLKENSADDYKRLHHG